jgi:hypothetical protein
VNEDVFKVVEKIDFNKPSLEKPHHITLIGGDGVQKIWRFKNNYGASVVRFKTPLGSGGNYGFEKGLWELAVIKFNSEGTSYEICYDTPITEDVIGYLTEEEVVELLKKIKALKRGRENEIN